MFRVVSAAATLALVALSSVATAKDPSWKPFIASVTEVAPGEASIAVTRKFMMLPMSRQTQLVADVCAWSLDQEPNAEHGKITDCLVERNGERIADVSYDAKDDTMAVLWEVWYKNLVLQREFARAK